MSAEIYKQTATELSLRIRKKELKPSEVCLAILNRNEATSQINAYTHINKEAALARAKELDNMPVTADTPAVFGLPVAVKDNICTDDMPTTCSSKMLQNFNPPYDATVVTRLRNAGAIIMGKTNMDEFGMGSSTKNSVFGATLNPHDTKRVPGGSSGGSAAAVAAGSALFALGTDTGGSIRLPAAFCGTVGYKPSFGAVSRYGCLPYAASFDVVGPLARTVADAALLATAIAGHDPLDARSNPAFMPDYSGISGMKATSVSGKRIGVVEECFDGLQDDIRQSIEAAIKTYESLGARVERISMPFINDALPVYMIIALAEASSNFARYDGVGFGHR
ncbi:MAG: amidase family protein, partial [Defluviitaleaceae bacterium]|nr:amidase family protein [Defluviitaleaceae bacterium]